MIDILDDADYVIPCTHCNGGFGCNQCIEGFTPGYYTLDEEAFGDDTI